MSEKAKRPAALLALVIIAVMAYAVLASAPAYAAESADINILVSVRGPACDIALFKGSERIALLEGASGETTLPLSVSFIGEEEYVLRIVSQDGGGVEYDKAEYAVKIVTVNEGGKLRAAAVIAPQEDGKGAGAEFVNRYTGEGTEDGYRCAYCDPPVEKRIEIISGSIKSMPSFTFRMFPESAGQPMPETYDPSKGCASVSITGEGSAEFGEFEIGPEYIGKTLRYRITELKEDAKGFTYDETVYTQLVRVYEEEGRILTEVSVISHDNRAHEKAVFTNTYKQPSSPGGGGDDPSDEPGGTPGEPEPGDIPDDPGPEPDGTPGEPGTDPGNSPDKPITEPGGTPGSEAEDGRVSGGEDSRPKLPQTGEDRSLLAASYAAAAFLTALLLIFARRRGRAGTEPGSTVRASVKKKAGIWLLAAVIALLPAGLSVRAAKGEAALSRQAGERSAELSALIRDTQGAAKLNAELQSFFEFEQEHDPVMSTVEIGGERYIGTIDIPVCSVSLPVNELCSDDRLNSGPCRYGGSFFGADMVICGHNYKSQFGPIRSLREGDSVFFRDASGNILEYSVAYLETVGPYDIEKMTEFTDAWDLTLFTCTWDGRERIAVRCRLC